MSHRSALEYKPSPQYEIILTGTTNRIVKYPGLTLHFVRGPKIQKDDPAFLGFHASSAARAYLENLSTTKATAWRSLPIPELEAKLETLLRVKGEAALNQIRDRARELAKSHDWQKEFAQLDQIIGALLGTRPSKTLKSKVAQARARGRPFDVARITRFDLLFAELRGTPLKEYKDIFKATDHFNNKAFFEAYFSNYIEGTLEKGFERYLELPEGLARAIFIMFVVAEVHPFTDGNGRIARIMMNAELFSQKLATIIIPTVHREDYMTALRALTRRNRPDPLIRMMTRAHQFSYLEYSPYKKILESLEEKNWFREPSEAKLIE
jgi:hypothetical protein